MSHRSEPIDTIKNRLLPFAIALLVSIPPAAYSQHSPATAPQQVRGTSVIMLKPTGFTESTNFSGFQDASSGASIMVTEIPGPFQKVTAGFTAAGLKTKAMDLISREEIKVGSFPGLFVEARQKAYGDVFHKWILSFGDQAKTVMVTATSLDSKAGSLSAPLKASLLTARLNPNMKPSNPRADLTFNVPDSAELKLANRIQNMLIFTTDGSLTSNKPADAKAVFIAGQSIAEIPITNHSEYARQRLTKTEKLEQFQIQSEGDINVAGLPGRELVATAIDSRSKGTVFVYLTLLFGPKTYYIMQGLVEASQSKKYEPVFKKMARSFTKK